MRDRMSDSRVCCWGMLVAQQLHSAAPRRPCASRTPRRRVAFCVLAPVCEVLCFRRGVCHVPVCVMFPHCVAVLSCRWRAVHARRVRARATRATVLPLVASYRAVLV